MGMEWYGMIEVVDLGGKKKKQSINPILPPCRRRERRDLGLVSTFLSLPLRSLIDGLIPIRQYLRVSLPCAVLLCPALPCSALPNHLLYNPPWLRTIIAHKEHKPFTINGSHPSHPIPSHRLIPT